jgi:hypothetical protein
MGEVRGNGSQALDDALAGRAVDVLQHLAAALVARGDVLCLC